MGKLFSIHSFTQSVIATYGLSYAGISLFLAYAIELLCGREILIPYLEKLSILVTLKTY